MPHGKAQWAKVIAIGSCRIVAFLRKRCTTFIRGSSGLGPGETCRCSMSDDPVLLPLYADWNTLMGSDDGREAYCIYFGVANPPALETKLKVGTRVIIHDVELRCEAILERSSWRGQWLGVLTPESRFEDLVPGEFERLRAATKRAAYEG